MRVEAADRADDGPDLRIGEHRVQVGHALLDRSGGVPIALERVRSDTDAEAAALELGDAPRESAWDEGRDRGRRWHDPDKIAGTESRRADHPARIACVCVTQATWRSPSSKRSVSTTIVV